MVDRALANMSRKLKHPMDEHRAGESEIEYLTFCTGLQVNRILDHMREMGLLGVMEMHTGGVDYSISPAGWARLDALSQKSAASKQAFVAMWFAGEMDAFYQQGIKPAIEAAGFVCRRVDTLEHNNKICDEIIAEIRKSRFIVADFTGQRGGVYFEAGYGMGMGLPIIWIVRKDDVEKLHFDTRQYNHIVYENAEDLKAKLYNRIAATIH
jgi:nucleoside 2-deoxyribosyltransferase